MADRPRQGRGGAVATGDGKDQVDINAERAAQRWAGIDPAVEAIVNRISKTARYLDRMLGETAAREGLNASEYRLLVTLWKSGPTSPGDLGKRLLVSSGVMTNRLDRLEERGFVARAPHPSDRRGILVSLTDTGLEVLSRMIERQARRETELLAALQPDERAELNALLRRLMTSFDPTIAVEEGGLSS